MRRISPSNISCRFSAVKGLPYDLDDVTGFVFQYQQIFSGIRSGIRNWQDRMIKQAAADKVVVSRLGRRLLVSDDVNHNSILNFPVQATASDGFKLASLSLDQALDGKDERIVHILHDEVIVEARQDIAEQVAGIDFDLIGFKRFLGVKRN
jgi:DNA polymerase-1